MLSPAELTLYVVREAFAGDLQALVKRETDAVTAKAGKVGLSGPTLLKIAGATTQGHRIRVHAEGRIDLRVMAVHQGSATILHCETPDVPRAWINVGSDCMIRGVTLHVAPPR